MKISVMLNNFRQPFDQALETAASLGIPAVQVTFGPTDDAVKISKSVHAAGLEISALSCDVGDLGEPDALEKVEKAKPLIDGAAAMGHGICQTHVGIMPHGMSGARWDNFVRASEALAAYAESVGACVALETGPEPARVMEKLMKTVDSPGLRVNYDPANLIIWPAVLPKFPDLREHAGIEEADYDRSSAWADFEPVEGVRRLAPYIVHTHAKDGVGNGGWADVPLGEGWIDWRQYLGLLRDYGYNGYLAIEREGGPDTVGEIAAGVRFLRSVLS